MSAVFADRNGERFRIFGEAVIAPGNQRGSIPSEGLLAGCGSWSRTGPTF